jgi:hypothetical protein
MTLCRSRSEPSRARQWVVPWSGLQTEVVVRTYEKKASGQPSAKKALKLFVSVPRSSRLASRLLSCVNNQD